MICPRCGSEVSAASARCARCAAPLGQTVATGLLTPPPPSGPGEAPTSLGDALTSLGEPATSPISGAAGVDEDRTINLAHTPRPDSGDAATVAPGAEPVPSPSDGGPLSPGQAFGSRYHIIRALGVGGMGAVYQAWDAELGVAVAIKVIRPEVMADPAAAAEVGRRFKRELLLARQVTHKNVVRIHDLGEIDGIKYITMSYVEGADLSTLLRREGTLLVPTVMRIARAVVSGLVEAHKAGVVHRDLKPANIMIDRDGDALIMDFGIARSSGGPKASPDADAGRLPVGVRRTAVTSEATRYGAVMGTVEYMAPEQARGQEVDQRADIYALGLMLYDMLVGRSRRTDRTTSAIAELQARMAQAPPPIKSLVPEIPDALDSLVSRCIEPDPDKRYQTTEDLATDLDRLDENGVPIPIPRRLTPRIMAASVLLVVSLVTATWWLTRTPPPPTQHPPVTVLVADVDNQTGEAVLDGTLEPALATALEGASFVSAYKRDSARTIGAQLRPGSKKLDEALARLVAVREGVNVVIASAVRRERNGYRLSTKAVDAATGKAIADRDVVVANRDAVLAAIGKLTVPIRKALGDTTPQSKQLAAAETFTAGSLEAAHEYSLGQELQQTNPQQAIKHYQNAVQLDPKLGRAFAGLAVTSITLKKRDDADKYYKTALSLVDHMSEREKLRTLGNYYGAFVHNYDRAVESFESLVSLYPGDDVAFNNLSVAYGFKLQFAKAAAAIKRARDLNPASIKYQFNYVTYLLYAGDFATAVTEGQRIVREHPEYQKTYLPLALAMLARGDVDGARDVYAKLEKINPSVAAIGKADTEMYFGRNKTALTILQNGIAADERDRNEGEMALKYVAKADALVALGQKPQASQAAKQAAQLSSDESVQFPAARALIAAGDEQAAEKIAAALDNTLQTQSRSYAQLIRAEIALAHKRYAEAIDGARAAQKQHDSWISQFLLGRAYLEAGHFPEALGSFDTCIKRLGEAPDWMFVNSATLRYLPPLYFWTARAQAGVGSTAAAMQNFRRFLALRGDSDTSDPLTAAARRAVSQ
jgi:eukaryotic-like serine/threonine-protein kinase